MAVPKKRTSSSKKKMRSANKGERFAKYSISPNGFLQMSHRMDLGFFYKKKQIIVKKEKAKED